MHRSNKASGKPICSNAPVTGSDMDVYCVLCTSSFSPPVPVVSPQSVLAVSVPVAAPSFYSHPAYVPPSSALSAPSPYPSHLYQYPPPHMLPSVPVSAPSAPSSAQIIVPGPASSVPPPSPAFVPPPAAQISAVFSEYLDLDSPCYYDVPLATSSHSVAALTFSSPNSHNPRLLLCVMLLLGKKIVHATALIDPGSTGDFINSRFTSLHPFTLAP